MTALWLHWRRSCGDGVCEEDLAYGGGIFTEFARHDFTPLQAMG